MGEAEAERRARRTRQISSAVLSFALLAGAASAADPPPPRFGEKGQFVISSSASVSGSSSRWDGSDAASFSVDFGPGFDLFPADHLSIGLGIDAGYGYLRGYWPDGTLVETRSGVVSLGPRLGWNVPIARRVSLWPRFAVGLHYTRETGDIVAPGRLGLFETPRFPAVSTFGAWFELRVPVVVTIARNLFLGVGPRLHHDLAAANVGPLVGAERTTASLAVDLGGYWGGAPSDAGTAEDAASLRQLDDEHEAVSEFGDKDVVVVAGELDSSAALTWYSRTDAATTSARVGAGADWFLSDRWSLGGAALYGNSHAVGFDPSGVRFDASRDSLIVPIRLGRAIPLGSSLSLYPRGTFSFGFSDLDETHGATRRKHSDTFSAVSLSVPLLVHFADRLFLGLGPYVSHDLSRATRDTGYQNRETTVGATTLLGGWL